MAHYTRFGRFILPLAITAIVFELGSQVLNGGMARVPQATETLAAFGLAWGLVLFLTGPLAQSKEMGLVLVDGPAAFGKVRGFVAGFGALLSGGLAVLALTPLSFVVVEGLHGIDATLGDAVRTAIFWFMPYPIIKGLALFHTGLLLRVRRTAFVSYATLSNLTVSIITVFIMLPLPVVQRVPILLPILVIYTGILVELSLMLWGCRRYAGRLTGRIPGPVLPKAPRLSASPAPLPSTGLPNTRLSLGDIVRFFWPLALIMLVQEFSRPLINVFVSRSEDATAALAVLAVAYTLGRIPYGWLNELRNLPSAFREDAGAQARIPRFTLICGGVSLLMMVGLFWTPLRAYILGDLIGLPPRLVELARTPMMIFAAFSFIVTARAYLHGQALYHRRTTALAPSGPARILAILLALLSLPLLGIEGATLGISALLAGFAVETLTVWWGLYGRRPLAFTKAQPTPHT
ncbi:MAG: hypothetical protein WDZ49_00575 [Litorilinea sp.]